MHEGAFSTTSAIGGSPRLGDTLFLCHSIFPTSSTPPELTRLLCHSIALKCYSSPLCEKPFHFSAMCGSGSNGLLTAPCDPRRHIQTSGWPGWPDAPLGCSPRPVLSGPRLPPCCRILSFRSLQGFDGV